MISIIDRIAKGIDGLIDKGVVSSDKAIILFGLHRYSYAMRTILSHRDIEVTAFLSDDEVEVTKTRRNIKDFACRYFKSERDVIEILVLGKEQLSSKKQIVILVAEKEYEEKKGLLINAGYKENIDFFAVYDFYEKDIDGKIQGMRKLSLDEIKDCSRNMLKIIDEYCNTNNLRYWVCGGSMLGAVRHKGFIPWDDDIDIFLPISDYMRLLKEFPKSDRYTFRGFGPDGGDGFYYPFVKMIDNTTYLDDDMNIVRELSGAFLDIFPLVGVPKDEDERIVFFSEYKELERSIVQDFYASDGDLSVFDRRFTEQESFLKKYDFDSSEYVGVLGTWYGVNDSTHREVYDKTIRMKFDDLVVNVPGGYDEYLSKLYGTDYMEIPPLSKRQTLHIINAYKVN